MTDRVAILDRIKHDLRRRLCHPDLRADDLAARPSEDDLASLAGEGMLGAAAAKLYANVRAGEGMRRCLATALSLRRCGNNQWVAHRWGDEVIDLAWARVSKDGVHCASYA